MNSFDSNDPTIALSPLADPVASAIFANAEVAGLSAESLIRATLKTDGDSKLLGKIVRVTPQRSHTAPRIRGCRVDVDTESNANEHVVFEIQMDLDSHIMQRDLFSASHIFIGTSSVGDTSAQMAAKMPRVIYINILGYNIRKDNRDMVQPFKVLYTKTPQRVAVHNFGGYNIQLPRVLEMKPDFTNSLYCWCYTLYTAHLEGKTVQEVIAVTPALQAYAEQDTGYRQFCEQYRLVVASPETRKEYALWVDAMMREEGLREGYRQLGREDVMEEAEEKIQEIRIEAEDKIQEAAEKIQEAAEKIHAIVRNLKNKGISNEIIAETMPLSLGEIESL